MAKKQKALKPTHLSLGEIPIRRWVGFAVADYLSMGIFAALVVVPLGKVSLEGEWSWLPATLQNFLPFVALFLFAVLYLRLICKTSLRELVVGEGGSVDWRQCRTIALLYLAGFAAAVLVWSGFGANLSLNTVGIAAILVNLLITLSMTWMQTTWEEIVFRGIFLRWSCGNKLVPTARCIGAGIVSSLLFMVMHGGNPEVLSQGSVADILLAFSAYLVSGVSLYVMDVAFGDLMPGCVIHWVNNFAGFAFVNQVGTVVITASFVVDSTPVTSLYLLGVTLMCYLPVYIYVFWLAKKGALPLQRA